MLKRSLQRVAFTAGRHTPVESRDGKRRARLIDVKLKRFPTINVACDCGRDDVHSRHKVIFCTARSELKISREDVREHRALVERDFLEVDELAEEVPRVHVFHEVCAEVGGDRLAFRVVVRDRGPVHVRPPRDDWSEAALDQGVLTPHVDVAVEHNVRDRFHLFLVVKRRRIKQAAKVRQRVRVHTRVDRGLGVIRLERAEDRFGRVHEVHDVSFRFVFRGHRAVEPRESLNGEHSGKGFIDVHCGKARFVEAGDEFVGDDEELVAVPVEHRGRFHTPGTVGPILVVERGLGDDVLVVRIAGNVQRLRESDEGLHASILWVARDDVLHGPKPCVSAHSIVTHNHRFGGRAEEGPHIVVEVLDGHLCFGVDGFFV